MAQFAAEVAEDDDVGDEGAVHHADHAAMEICRSIGDNIGDFVDSDTHSIDIDTYIHRYRSFHQRETHFNSRTAFPTRPKHDMPAQESQFPTEKTSKKTHRAIHKSFCADGRRRAEASPMRRL